VYNVYKIQYITGYLYGGDRSLPPWYLGGGLRRLGGDLIAPLPPPRPPPLPPRPPVDLGGGPLDGGGPLMGDPRRPIGDLFLGGPAGERLRRGPGDDLLLGTPTGPRGGGDLAMGDLLLPPTGWLRGGGDLLCAPIGEFLLTGNGDLCLPIIAGDLSLPPNPPP